MDEYGQFTDVRLTARCAAKAARAFLRQAGETVRLYQPLTIITDKAATYAKVIDEISERLWPEDAIRHVTGKHLNNRIESDHAALMRLLRPMRGFRDLSSAKATFKGIESFRAARGVAQDIAFVPNLFKVAA